MKKANNDCTYNISDSNTNKDINDDNDSNNNNFKKTI